MRLHLVKESVVNDFMGDKKMQTFNLRGLAVAGIVNVNRKCECQVSQACEALQTVELCSLSEGSASRSSFVSSCRLPNTLNAAPGTQVSSKCLILVNSFIMDCSSPPSNSSCVAQSCATISSAPSRGEAARSSRRRGLETILVSRMHRHPTLSA